MDDPTALFRQYETDYCNKSTDISRKITSIASLTGGMGQNAVKDAKT
jgi:vesicle transport through interaction with t-SNAREs protein 1